MAIWKEATGIAADTTTTLTTQVPVRCSRHQIDVMGPTAGFTPEHVFMARPDLALSDEVVVDGEVVSVPRFRSGNWCADDNPEFM